MIKHIVMWRLKENALGKSKEENAKQLKTDLEGLVGVVESLKKAEVGIDICDSDQSFDVVLYSEFDDEDGLNAYQTHPKHVEIGKFVAEIRTDRVVVDYEV